MDPIQKLAERFADLPGIGPRQAKRFVYFLLAKNGAYIEELAGFLHDLKRIASRCRSCQRFYAQRVRQAQADLCPVCGDPLRDTHTLMIVERDVDFETIEKSGAYKGVYFILGGTMPILAKQQNHIRLDELTRRVRNAVAAGSLKEIIFALSVTTEGDHTKNQLQSTLTPLVADKVRFSTLGRGLSTGLELEYSDMDTIKNALDNRK